MRAITYQKYGGPEVLNIEDIEVPKINETQVLVKVAAISLNKEELHFMRATIILIRFLKGLFKPKNKILGADFSGTVVKIGAAVTQFKEGDKVFGRSLLNGYAEFVPVSEKRISLMPKNLTFEEAASVPLAATTAYQALITHGKAQSGYSILINGGSGGVGSFAIQIAKALGAQVTTICSEAKIEFVKSLGADNVLNYKTSDVKNDPKEYDLAIDIVGTLDVKEVKRKLKTGGICVKVGFESMSKILIAMLYNTKKIDKSRKNIRMMTSHINQKDLTIITRLIESDFIKPIVDRIYPFSEVREAFSHLDTNRAKGKIVLNTVSQG